MNKVWIYSITFYNIDDEYGMYDWYGTYTEVFSSKESAERFKKDFEDPKNLKYLEFGNSNLKGCNLYKWCYKGDSYDSSIDCKEIMNY